MCKGDLQSDPRICSFLLHGDFKYRQISSAKTNHEAKLETYIKNTTTCLKNDDSFELCKESFCYFTQRNYTGLMFPECSDFLEKAL